MSGATLEITSAAVVKKYIFANYCKLILKQANGRGAETVVDNLSVLISFLICNFFIINSFSFNIN